MASLIAKWRVVVATLVALVLVVGAYLLAQNSIRPPHAVASAEQALLEAISKKDSDGDGLPDWEEALYGTDAHKIDTRSLGMTDSEAVAKGLIVPSAVTLAPPATTGGISSAAEYGLTSPAKGSLTESFARNFFSLYIGEKQARGGRALTGEESAALAKKAVEALASTIAPVQDYKTEKDIAVSGQGVAALRSFAATAEAVLVANQVDATKSELSYLEDMVVRGNTSAAAHLRSIARGYRSTAAGLAALPVPQELALPHLALINALARVGDITNDFALVEGDPLATMFALGQYTPTVLDLGNAFIAIGRVYSDAGITMAAGEPGGLFANFMKALAAEQPPAIQQ